MNASTHHRRKLTILTELIYLKDTSIAATQLCCSFSVFLSMINQQKLYMCTRMGHLANHTHKPYIFGLKILSILCMQRHDFAIAVKGTTSERGWVCLSDIPCSKSLRSCSAAGSPNLCRNMKLRVYQQDNICCSHFFVFSYVELATPRVVHWWKSTRQWPVSGPVLDGHGAYCPAQGQITHTNHTSMNLNIV